LQTMKKSLFAAVLTASVHAANDNPLGKVLQLMDDLSTKIAADGDKADKVYHEYFEWCDDTAKNQGFEIKTATAAKEKLESSIKKLTSDIEVAISQIEDLGAAIAEADKELRGATNIRKKEEANFVAAETELAGAVDTLDRAINILEREMSNNPAAFAQIDTSNMEKLASAIGAVVDAAAFSSQDQEKLTALVQAHAADEDDEAGAPAPDAYKSHSGGIVDILADMKEKADSELSELRKAESTAKHNFKMLKQSLEGQIAADTKDLDEEKSGKNAAEEKKSADEGDLVVTSKELAAATSGLASTRQVCLQTAADHEASIASRKEELKVVAEAKKILEETSSGAVEKTYSFMQLSAQKKSRVVALIQNLAKEEHSASLAQLVSKIGAVMQYSNGADVFAKVKGLINDMIAKLEAEAQADAEEKAYCDKEMSETEAKKSELDDSIEALTTKIDQAASKSASLKGDVKELQQELAALAKQQAEMDKVRGEQHASYVEDKADLEEGLGGVQKALEKLREYYGGAALIQNDSNFGAFMQQPAAPESHSKSSGAGGSIINILEVCESDFSKSLAKVETEEADSAEQYDTTTQENKITTKTKQQDVKYKTGEFKSLDKTITELSSDKDTVSGELAAVVEYYGKVKERCVAKPETFEERTKRRTAEIEGLKQALSILEEETAFVQRRKRNFRHTTLG